MIVTYQFTSTSIFVRRELSINPRDGVHEKRKRKHGNQVVHIVTVYENKCRMMRPFGGRNLEFGVNHVLQCLFHVCASCFLYSLEYWCLCVLCLNVLLSSCYFCTYDPVLQMDGSTVKDNQKF